jgi:hypothetical protein
MLAAIRRLLIQLDTLYYFNELRQMLMVLRIRWPDFILADSTNLKHLQFGFVTFV